MPSSAPSPRPAATTFAVCFVCTGNICRSPMAESVFRARVRDAGLEGRVLVDSAGTDGWHEGDGADPRTVAVLAAAGFGTDHVARQFQADWFDRLDLVIALDRGHLRTLRRLAPTPRDAEKVRLLRSYDPAVGSEDGRGGRRGGGDLGDLDVPDPYYGDFAGFEECLKMVEAASDGLLDAVQEALEGRAA
ncbi:low molecular weight protein-tyrosine-phosphatase [Streptomyces longispororuber]|uniref:protein-tyrosine-phosphatase n=1 Tax=Streptomyces longispororuber TaxID=68230 RepID=A0A918ZBL5_9ACTN|nr:low molecular weight protein-tyrosine-phosphatase [Streptomyces longispororuber]GHE42133.1 low molecular weight protein-tyrosine-phosphatase [Streptomyces longispororuber]